MPARLLPALEKTLERRLKAEQAGDVHFDAFTRGRYATDASHYQIMPVGMVAPRSIEDAERALAICRAEGVAVTARGGGTSQAGQTVNHSLIVDCSQYLNRIVEIDAAGRRCVVEPGIVLDELNRALKPHGLWFPVDISTASRATIGGMVGNNSCGARSLRYGNTRENIVSIDAVLADGTRAHFGRMGESGVNVPPALVRDLVAIASREAAEIERALSKSAAPRRRLQSRRHRSRAQRYQSGASTGRFGGHARLFDRRGIEALAASWPPRGRRLPFR